MKLVIHVPLSHWKAVSCKEIYINLLRILNYSMQILDNFGDFIGDRYDSFFGSSIVDLYPSSDMYGAG